MTILWIIFSKRSYMDLTSINTTFTAKANNLNKITGHINNDELTKKNATLKILDNVTKNIISECAVIIKADRTFKCKFKPVKNTKNKTYYFVLLADNKNIIPANIKIHYYLTLFEAAPLLLINAALNKPFPFNQSWFYITLLILYIILLTLLLRRILLLTICNLKSNHNKLS